MNPQPTGESLGQFIRSKRLEKKMTQQRLAAAVGFKSVAFVSDVESGTRMPGDEYFARIANALDVPVDELRARDPRVPVQETREFVRKHPEYAAAFRKMVTGAQRMSADELTRRLDEALRVDPRPPDDSKEKT
jgi:transcriptional regulator with XRE-family HTH domain